MGLGIKLHYGTSATDGDVNGDMDFFMKVQSFVKETGGIVRKYRKTGRTIRTVEGMFDSFSKKSVNGLNRALKEKAEAEAKETGTNKTFTRFNQADAILAMAGLGERNCAPLERDAETFINQLKREMKYEHFVPSSTKRAVIEWLMAELVSAEENSEFLQFTDIAIDDGIEAPTSSTPNLDVIFETPADSAQSAVNA